MKNKQIKQICEKCAEKQGLILVGIASVWEDICDVCLEETMVADIYDFSPKYQQEDF